VRLLFQPAKEGPGGALPMTKAGCLEGLDEVYDMVWQAHTLYIRLDRTFW
jgi:metal-dependent amidase/aminoacylase/carboxypeptidase family protein